MKTVLIEARRTSYSLKGCGRTMTVGELINWLDQFDEDAKVYLSHDDCNEYGPIDDYDFSEWSEPDEEEDLPNDPLDPEAAKTAEPIEPHSVVFSRKAKDALAYLEGCAFLYRYKGRYVLTDESLQLTDTDGSNGTPVGGPRWTGYSLEELNKWLEDWWGYQEQED